MPYRSRPPRKIRSRSPSQFVKWAAGPGGATRDIWLEHLHFPPYSFNDPEAIDIFLNLHVPARVDRFHNYIADPSVESRWEPTFTDFPTIKGEWQRAVDIAYRGDGDVINLINENMPRWQRLLDEFWSAVDAAR